MPELESELIRRLDHLRGESLYRQLRNVDSPQSPHVSVNGRGLLNFSSNDYLGLANHPMLKTAAQKAVERFGVGSGASRLICGSLAPHTELEEALAAFKGTEAALSFSSGYSTALGVISSLMNSDDVIVLDRLVHASIVDASRLSRAKLRVFAHNDLNELEDILKWTRTRKGHTLIVTESVFSMDGDRAPLKEIVALKEQYGAWLMVDEAHATGIIGRGGRGLAEELGVGNRVDIQMGTLGKALGSAGGYICGSRALADFLINRARSFIFSTAPLPAAAAAATAALALVQSETGETAREQLWRNANTFHQSATAAGWKLAEPQSAILPLIIGAEADALAAAAALLDQNILIPAIRYPSVAKGEARLRVTVTSAHSAEDMAALRDALANLPAKPSHA